MRPDQYVEIRIVRRMAEPITAVIPIEEDAVRCLSSLPKNREIDRNEQAAAVLQRQQRSDLSKEMGVVLAARILKACELHDTVNGYPQEGKPDVEPFNYIGLGHALARLMVANPFFLEILADFPRGDELADLLMRYVEAEDRWARDPNQRANPFKEVNAAIDLLKRLNLPKY